MSPEPAARIGKEMTIAPGLRNPACGNLCAGRPQPSCAARRMCPSDAWGRRGHAFRGCSQAALL